MTIGTDDPPSPGLQQDFWNTWNIGIRQGKSLPPGIQARGAAVLDFLQSKSLKDQRIIEVGCGTGWLCEHLQRFGAVLGVDLADQAIESARNACPDAEFRAGDFMKLDLPRDHFDVVVCLETLSHVEDQQAFLDRIADILKPGGYLALTTQNRSVMVYADVVPQAPGQIRKWLTMRQLKGMVANRFDLLRATTVHPPSGHRGLLRLVNSVKLNGVAGLVWRPGSIRRFKERLGLGEALVMLAQRRR